MEARGERKTRCRLETGGSAGATPAIEKESERAREREGAVVAAAAGRQPRRDMLASRRREKERAGGSLYFYAVIDLPLSLSALGEQMRERKRDRE